MSATNQVFPRVQARDLTGATRWLPDAFEGERNVVFVAFRRQQQTVIDSWAHWLRAQASGIFAYEVLRRLTIPLQITDRSTVWIFLVARGGRILERASGGYCDTSAERLLAA